MYHETKLNSGKTCNFEQNFMSVDKKRRRKRRIVALTLILQDLTGDEIDEMIREADLDGDGKVKHL